MDKISLSLLGTMRVQVDDRSIDSAFRTKKERALLAYLAVEGRKQHSREMLAELLWPDRPEGYARTNLRQALMGLRRTLGSEILIDSEEFLRYGLGSTTWLDMQVFQSLIQSAQTHQHHSSKSCRSCVQQLEQAAALYRGDFLEDLLLPECRNYQEWVVFYREQLYRLFLGALTKLSEYYQFQGDYEKAYHYNWLYVSSAPLEEDAHRQLMRLLAYNGHRSAALEQYQAVKLILARELGVEPSRETTELYEQIRSGQAASPEHHVQDGKLSNLPGELTSFVGREDEIARLQDCLSRQECHFITLIGPAGVGKTRAAVHTAASRLDQFPDGVWYVDLQEVTDAKMLALRIARTMNLAVGESDGYISQLLDLLRPLKTLLVLDPFEQLIHTTGFLIDMLKEAAGLKIIVASRRRLNYQSACVFELSGLPYPQKNQIDRAMEFPAVKLFLARAQQNQAPVEENEAVLQKVVQICRLVDGIPLAIELAAGTLREISLDHLLGGLQQGLTVLSSDLQDVPGKHQNMTSALQTSWVLLGDEERRVLRRLASLSSEFSAETAKSQADASSRVLSTLVDFSLIKQIGVNRYVLPAMIRHFATEKQSEDLIDPKSGHAYFQNIPLLRISPMMKTGPLNMELFWDRLEHTLARARRYNHSAALIILDVKHWIDQASTSEFESRTLLNEAGQCLSAALRRTDTVSYLGAARLAIVLDELAAPQDTELVISKMYSSLEGLISRNALKHLRMGIAIHPEDGTNLTRLFAVAEKQLAEARAAR